MWIYWKIKKASSAIIFILEYSEKMGYEVLLEHGKR